MRRRSLAQTIREMSDRAVERNQPMWMVRLEEPPDTIYAKRSDHSLANLVAVLYGTYGMTWAVSGTDRDDVACVRTTTPICVLGVPEEFMRLFVATLRANKLHGTYRKAGTEREYEF